MKINEEKEDSLTQNRLKEVLRYDSHTGTFIWIKKTHPNVSAINVGDVAGTSKDINGYSRIGIDGYYHFAHRLVWLYVQGSFPQKEQPYIDHISGNPSDNRIINLRVSSTSENAKNRKKRPSSRTSDNGVYLAETVIKRGGYVYTYFYWTASWYDENGEFNRKLFPVNKLGEDAAKAMAITHRAEQIRLLEQNHGIVYSERHGK